MKQELRKVVKGYVESQELNSDQLHSLTKLINTHGEKNNQNKLVKFRVIAAVIVVSIALGLFWGYGINTQANVSQSIAEEVAHNHLKMKPMEVSSTSLSDVRRYFNKLDFSLSQSKFVANTSLQLIGGRYCSILGETAAQLRMTDEATGNMQIIYQAPYDQELFRELPSLEKGQDPVRHYVNGISVDVWVEKGILFARSFN